jgi:hypothetical protein
LVLRLLEKCRRSEMKDKEKGMSDVEVSQDGYRGENGAFVLGGQSWCFCCGKKYVSSKLIEKTRDSTKCPNCGKKLVPQR